MARGGKVKMEIGAREREGRRGVIEGEEREEGDD